MGAVRREDFERWIAFNEALDKRRGKGDRERTPEEITSNADVFSYGVIILLEALPM